MFSGNCVFRVIVTGDFAVQNQGRTTVSADVLFSGWHGVVFFALLPPSQLASFLPPRSLSVPFQPCFLLGASAI
jgi:hypothetical protein